MLILLELLILSFLETFSLNLIYYILFNITPKIYKYISSTNNNNKHKTTNYNKAST